MAKLKAQQNFVDPDRGPLVSTRFVIAIVMVLLGIAWMVYYYTQVRVDPTAVPPPKAGSPAFMADLKDWNYAIGFGLILLGLLLCAHPSTPLGRDRHQVGVRPPGASVRALDQVEASGRARLGPSLRGPSDAARSPVPSLPQNYTGVIIHR